MSNDERHEVMFEDSLEDTDFGFIVCGKTGRLKGLWIPKELEDEEVPENIVNLCIDVFGIDESEFFEETDGLGTPPTGSIH